MSTHTYKKCPHCNKTYESYTTYNKSLHDHDGSPFLVCKNCGEVFFDKDYREIAFDGKPKKINFFQALLNPWWFLVLIAIFFFWAGFDHNSYGPMIVGLIFFAIYLSIVVVIWIKRDKIYKNVLIEYERSLIRVSDKKYVISLLNHKYKVPRKFLEINYPDLINYKPSKTPKIKNTENKEDKYYINKYF